MLSAQEAWWKSVFEGPWVEVQKIIKSAERTKREVDFIEGVLQDSKGSEVLDCPCGTGRLSLELSTRGYKVTGVDLSAALLQEGQRNADSMQVDTTFENRDMRDLPWESRFDAVICFWGSYGYFDEAGNLDFLRAVFRTLKPGGQLILDTHVFETLHPGLSSGGRMWEDVGDHIVLKSNDYEHRTGICTTQLVIVSDGEVHRETTTIRIYTYRELAEQLEGVGFTNLEDFGSLTKEAFTINSERLYLVARRPSRALADRVVQTWPRAT